MSIGMLLAKALNRGRRGLKGLVTSAQAPLLLANHNNWLEIYCPS